MIKEQVIPLFPLGILPLPNELVPLHVFEPRYRQLLVDIEEKEMNFGIYYSHALNKDRVGGLMRLESILKRYDTGESDIVVRCIDTFLLTKFYNRYPPKLYPAGKVVMLNSQEESGVSNDFSDDFKKYMSLKNISTDTDYNIHDIANELNLDISDRLKYLKLLTQTNREMFLRERLKYREFILRQEQKVQDNFFLN